MRNKLTSFSSALGFLGCGRCKKTRFRFSSQNPNDLLRPDTAIKLECHKVHGLDSSL